MYRNIYVLKDQVSGQFGGVLDFANDAECIRSFRAACALGNIPAHAIRDTVIIRIAQMDISGDSPVVTPLMPVIIYYGSEVNFSDENS